MEEIHRAKARLQNKKCDTIFFMICVVEDCKNKNIVAKSMCAKHYHRDYRYGDTSFYKQDKNQSEFCNTPNCNRKSKSKSLCEAHYARFNRVGENFSTKEIRKNFVYSKEDSCIVPRCNNRPHAKKMCKNHYNQQHKHKIDFFEIIPLLELGCMVCGSFETLSIDHDHAICSEKIACNKCFRGILCGPCNRALGIVNDDKQILKNMVEYLEK